MGVRPRRITALWGVTALVAATLLAGCSASSSDSRSTGSEAAPAKAAAGAGTARDADRPALADAPFDAAKDTPAKAPDVVVDQRAIIYTGSITVRVPNVDEAATEAASYATGAGGFVGSDKRNSADGAGDATLELRVPAAKFSNVVDRVSHLGKEQSRGVDTQDVTEETIDVDARIATQQARVNSGRALLARAKSLSDLVMLESELAKREADLASLNAKKHRLADLTALSTITVVLLSPAAVVHQKAADPGGFVGGLKHGWRALVASLSVLLTVFGALLPWLIALGLPAWAAFWLLRRFGRLGPRLAPAGATGAGSASGPAPRDAPPPA